MFERRHISVYLLVLCLHANLVLSDIIKVHPSIIEDAHLTVVSWKENIDTDTLYIVLITFFTSLVYWGSMAIRRRSTRSKPKMVLCSQRIAYPSRGLSLCWWYTAWRTVQPLGYSQDLVAAWDIYSAIVATIFGYSMWEAIVIHASIENIIL